MSRQERMAKSASCPRCVIGRMFPAGQAQLNPRSKDGSQICEECKLDEIYGEVTADAHARFLGEENV